MTCYECGSQSRAIVRDYVYSICGVKGVILNDLTLWKCDGCGDEMPEFHAISSLHRVIAMDILRTVEGLIKNEDLAFVQKAFASDADIENEVWEAEGYRNYKRKRNKKLR